MINPDFLFFALKSGNDDWVSFAEMRSLYFEALGASMMSDANFWSDLERLLIDGYFIAGEVDERGFAPWAFPVDESIAAMKRKIVGIPRLIPGDVCWFDLTDKGQAELKQIESGNIGRLFE